MTVDDIRLLEARWRLGELAPEDLHAVADDLIAAGVLSDEVTELFAMTQDELRWDGADQFERVLAALGGSALGEDDAVAVFVRHLTAQVAHGGLGAAEMVETLARVYVRSGYRHEKLAAFHQLHDEIGYLDRQGRSYLGRSAEEIEHDVRAAALAASGGERR